MIIVVNTLKLYKLKADKHFKLFKIIKYKVMIILKDKLVLKL